MKYYIIAGEASGDLHASNLMRELSKLDTSAEFRAWGGDLMEAQGAILVKHYRNLAFMGFTEVVMNLRTILKNIETCKKDLLAHKPDVLILVDYPGFNLRIAEYAKAQGIRVFYYISPQVWAWKQSRVHKIKRTVDRMFVILPFEKEFYQKFDYPVDFVGHPLLDAITQKKNLFPSKTEFIRRNSLEDKPIIALLPGSRKQEIETMLPLMLSVQKDFPSYRFVIAGAPSQPDSFYQKVLGKNGNPVIHGQTYELLTHADAALVTSGTATLETALLKVPEVVCYKGGTISYYIARSLVKINYISLVNLIMDQEVVKELIQHDLNTPQITRELRKILDPDYRSSLLKKYDQLANILGGSGASAHTARLMFQYLQE
ncbi:MAG: lipid-A-disaccharide synthase [Bacteroidia bacterium]